MRSGNLQTDTEAAEGLIRQYLKQQGQRRVVADRGFANGDAAIINMVIAPKSNPAAPYPGLEKEKFYFDADEDVLGMTQVWTLELGLYIFHGIVCVHYLQHMHIICN